MNKMLMSSLLCCVAVTGLAESESLKAAVTNGTFKGTVGTYMEYRDFAAEDRDFGWGTGYVYLKAESDWYMRTRLGVSFLGHTPLWRDAENDNETGPYKADIEERWGIPEIYLDFGLTDENKTMLRVGRWSNKGTHIDDSHSEGFYLSSKEWDNVSFTVGGFRRFAELDYDDGEDFGRQNDSQFLGDNSSFGPDADAWAFFVEADVDAGVATLSPYVYTHNGYASVFGLDTVTSVEVDEDTEVGLRVDGYFVQADSATGFDDGWAATAAPFVAVGPFDVSVGYIAMSGEGGGTQNLNKPRWFKDYLAASDQLLPFNNNGAMQGLDSVYGKVKFTHGAFWTHFVVADHSYNSSSIGTDSRELELQFGYDLGNGMDVNLRLMDCEFEGTGASAVDYQKAEMRARYRF